ncbi:MAG: alpha/beta hydrolase [Paracoccaceae bacterium]
MQEALLEERILYADGPLGPLEGVLTLPDTGALDDRTPVVMIVPGSGPTDRDGNSPLGITASPYRMFAFVFAAHGIPVLRADKRGMFASEAAVADANKVTIADYGDDLVVWSRVIDKTLPVENGGRPVIVAGHSEGGLVALAAAARVPGCTGLILLACPGRPLGQVLRSQLQANPANAPLLPQAFKAISQLEAQHRVAASDLPASLRPLFADAVQDFLIDLFAHDPATLISSIQLPCLIAQGTEDLQVSVADAEALHRAQPNAQLTLIEGMNHVLKIVPPGNQAANLASYQNPDLPVSEALVQSCIALISNA